MRQSDNCIVSFANSKGNYIKGVARLAESLRNNSEGIDFISFIGEASVKSPLHTDVPYAFKIHCFKRALEAGYRNILYLDSSVFAIKNVKPVFDEIEHNGFIFQDAGHYLSKWINDYTLAYFNLGREQTEGMKMIGNAGFLGLNFNEPIAHRFFDKWSDSMEDGCFKGSWTDHRHDMSCSSLIINQMGLADKMKDGDKWLQYAGLYQETANETIIFKAEGL